MRASSTSLLILLTLQLSFAQTFENIASNVSFENHEGKIMLGDIDNDGYPEIIISGTDRFIIYRNSNGLFSTEITKDEFRFNNHVFSVDIGDVNNDGFIDILHSGNNYDQRNTPQLLLNQGSSPIEFSGVNNSPFWSTRKKYLGDYEGDGDLDIIASDQNGILLNQKNNWIPGPYFPKSGTWYSNWCNLDEDSKLEVIQVHGISNALVGTYRLDDGLPTMLISSTFSYPSYLQDIKFADYDSDGDLDMLAKKQDPSGNRIRILNNTNGVFDDSEISFEWGESMDFGDINNDGLYDVVVSGTMTGGWMIFETVVYLNDGNGSFSKLNIQLPSLQYASGSIGDFDGDGDLDIATQTGLFKNKSPVINSAPLPPTVAVSNVSGTTVELFWGPGSDDKTPLQGLTYNIEVRDESGAIIVSSHALASGKRQVFKLGNAYNHLAYQLSCLKQGKYYWRVQTLDASFQGSSFSTEQSFIINNPPPVAPSGLTSKAISEKSIQLTWQDMSTSEDGFIIFRKNTDSESEYYPIDTVALNATSYLDTLNLLPETTYSYRVAASNCAYPDEIFAGTSVKTFPPPFINSGWLDLGNVKASFALLGDYDKDRDLDLIITYSGQTKLFRFDETGYVDSGISFSGAGSAGTWLDINSDGYLDVLLVVGSVAKFYENVDGVSFKVINNNPLPNINWQAGISMGDYDNNGSEDMLVQTGSVMRIYNNEGNGKFIASGISLPGYLRSSGAWADFDKDGDLDILTTKEISCTAYNIVVFENKSGSFVPIEFTTLTGINRDYLNFTGEMEWGDYDNDGYPDILVAGQNTCGNGSSINRIYRNQRNRTFAPAFQLVGLVYDVNVDWGDYDNDGDLDVFAYGDPFSGHSSVTRIYRNERNQFKDAKINGLLESTQYGKAVRGDIDHDGDLDYVILGEANYTTPRVTVFRNMLADRDWNRPNHSPIPPTGLQSSIDEETITLSWASATDLETAQAGLTYNLYITNEKDSIILNSYSLADGYRTIVSPGNASSQLSWKLKNIPPGTYRWAVQAIDKGFTGSAFSQENTFSISPITGIEEAQKSIFVYPNPTRDFLTVVSNNFQLPLAIVIRNSVGRVVLSVSQNTAESTYDLSSFPKGIYYITVRKKNNEHWTQKVVTH